MRKLLNTLYVTTPESYLAREGENILVKVKDEIRFRVPIHNLEGIVCFGYIGASPSAMHLCSERGVELSFLTEHGKFLARVSGEVSGNVLLRRKQYRWADEEHEKLRLAKRFVEGKIHNSRRVLQRVIRDHGDVIPDDGIGNTIDRMKDMIGRVENATSVDTVRGIEGEAANAYFSKFDSLVMNQKEHFTFGERIKRPPTDYVNALLSFVYTLLAHECISALETVGLDPQVGYLHTDRPGRKSLALDVMEELRPYLADRMVLSLINRKQVSENGFVKRENGAVLMNDETRKEVLISWQNRKREEIVHTFLEEKIQVGLIPYVQSMLLARNIRGDLDDYPPFLWK
ncbi:MAG: type I-C CRISPR-associated endonuclease Cas1c [Candidatus Thermoplasmatota archaeon]|nr:type I-C CRISPR-associated endonuclease Cas1c [Candidatus Thermoplasmatota archaeon]MCL5785790.1 type I-C CRISPR-associated endonuclease Cas1c [Candidatus Thermoplasmatota archaeon]